MEILEGYVDPPITPNFFNPVPSKGFRLIETGSLIPASWFCGGEGIRKVGIHEEECLLRVYPREKECSEEVAEKRRSLLLLPIGSCGRAINTYHPYFNGEEPLFQQFAKLETDESILEFAGRFGQLKNERRTTFPSGKAYLESLDFWKREISLVRQLLRVWGDYQMDQNIERYLRFGGERVIFLPYGKRLPFDVPFPNSRGLPLVPSESKKETLFRFLAYAIHTKMTEAPLTVSHGWGDGTLRSYLIPLSLQGAIWLQLSQGFFNDGPKEWKVRRCVLTGDFFRVENDAGEKIMWKKKTGPLKGHYYHREMANRFYEQKRKRNQAAEKGKTVKEGRKGATKFLVGFDDF